MPDRAPVKPGSIAARPARRAASGGLALALLLCTGFAMDAPRSPAGEKLRLARKFAATQVVYYVLEREENTRQLFSILPIPMNMHRSMTDTWVERVRLLNPDGTATIEWSLDRAQYQRNSEKANYKFDSISDEPNQESRPIMAMINRPLPQRQALTGTALPAHHAGALPPAATQLSVSSRPAVEIVGPPAPSTAPPAAPRQSNMPYYEPDDVQKLLGRLASDFLPARAVAPGDSWDISFFENKSAIGTVVHRLRYTLTGVEPHDSGSIALIQVEGDVGIESAGPGGNDAADRRITIKKGRWTGDVRFDISRGRVESLSLRHDCEISAEMHGKDNLVIDMISAEDRTIRMRSCSEPPPKPIVVRADRAPASAPAVARPPRMPASYAASQPWRRPYRFNPAASQPAISANGALAPGRPRRPPTSQALRPGEPVLGPASSMPGVRPITPEVDCP